MGANLVVASKSDTMQACMSKMVARDIRHLPVVDEDTGTVRMRKDFFARQQMNCCDGEKVGRSYFCHEV